ncbi:MAG: PAS domain S-box protein [Polyangiaceae bacterium]
MATDFAHFFDLSLDPLATFDREGHFAELNPAWTEATGFSRDDLAGAALADLTHPDDQLDLAATFERVVQGDHRALRVALSLQGRGAPLVRLDHELSPRR